MNRPLALLALLGLLAPRPACAKASPNSVGQLIAATGRVEIRHPGQPARKGARFSPLRAGDVVGVGPGSAAELVLFANGARFSLPAGSAAQVRLQSLTPRSGPAPTPQRPIPLAYVRAIRRPPPLYSSSQRQMLGTVVRSSDELDTGPRRPTPVGAVRPGPVTLRWSGEVQEPNWHLQINDGRRFFYEKRLSSDLHEFTVPAGTLRPGQTYVWSVTAVDGIHNGPRCAALLRVLTPEEAATMTQLEQETKSLRVAAPDDSAPLLLLAQAYERLDMQSEARDAYQELLRLQPASEDARAGLAALEKRIAALQRSPQ